MTRPVICILAIALTWCAYAEEPQRDAYGGLKNAGFEPGPFFRLEKEGPRWWFVTPDGGAFLSFGVNHITPRADAIKGTDIRPYETNVLTKHGDVETWTRAVHQRLRQWGFNTVGAWSSDHLNALMPRCIILSVSRGHWMSCVEQGRLPDFFGAAFVEHVEERAKQAARYKDDPLVIGYFLDNELPWAPDHNNGPELFDNYVALPPEAPGKQRLVQFFMETYGAPEEFSTTWQPAITSWGELPAITELTPNFRPKAREDRTAFSLIAAQEYFRVTTEAVRRNDPNHLILGCRFIPQTAPRVAVQACGEYCDVVSVNFYETAPLGWVYFQTKASTISRMPQDGSLSEYYEEGKKPVMVTEFSFRAMDSGMPNTYPPPYAVQPTVETQADRADKFEHYVLKWMAQPWFVGAHWFEHADEPKEGRFDGEDGNYGLVNIEDEPYTVFVERVTEILKQARRLHAFAEEE